MDKKETKKGIGLRMGVAACLGLVVVLLLLAPWMSKTIQLVGTLHNPETPRNIRLDPSKVECVTSSPVAAAGASPAVAPLGGEAASPVAAKSPEAAAGTSNAQFSSLWQLNIMQGAPQHTDIGAWPVIATNLIRAHMEKTSSGADARNAGPSMQPATCDEIYGLTFIHSWKQAQLCKPDGPANSETSSSFSGRYVTLGAGGHKPGRYMVAESFNVVLDSQAFSSSFDDGDPRPAAGSIKAACSPVSDSEAWRDYTDLRALSGVLRTALQGGQGAAVQQACTPGSGHIVDHPVLLLQRYDTTNIYHFLEDVLTTFTSLSVLNSTAVKQQGVEVVIADDKSLGFYLEVWQRLSFPYPLRVLKREPFPPNTCFRHIIYTQFAPPTLFSLKWQQPQLLNAVGGKDCLAPLYIGMAGWLRSLFPEITQLSRTLAVPLQSQDGSGAAIVTKTVLWVSRRNYESIHRGSFTDWQQRRIYGNENQLLIALSAAILDWNDQSCFRNRAAGSCRAKRVVYELQVIEPSDLAFYPRQLQSFAQMSILMGVHGAGMANAMWMQPFSGGVLEVQHNVHGQPHYSHLSQALGHRYTEVHSSGDNIDIAKTVAALKAMMDDLA